MRRRHERSPVLHAAVGTNDAQRKRTVRQQATVGLQAQACPRRHCRLVAEAVVRAPTRGRDHHLLGYRSRVRVGVETDAAGAMARMHDLEQLLTVEVAADEIAGAVDRHDVIAVGDELAAVLPQGGGAAPVIREKAHVAADEVELEPVRLSPVLPDVDADQSLCAGAQPDRRSIFGPRRNTGERSGAIDLSRHPERIYPDPFRSARRGSLEGSLRYRRRQEDARLRSHFRGSSRSLSRSARVRFVSEARIGS